MFVILIIFDHGSQRSARSFKVNLEIQTPRFIDCILLVLQVYWASPILLR